MTDLYLGIVAGQACAEASSARLKASNAELELDSERDRRRDLEVENAALAAQVKHLKKQLLDMGDTAAQRARSASAGLIVMKSVVKAMSNLPPNVRDSFKNEVVNLSTKRISEVDEILRKKSKADNTKLFLVSEIFREQHYELYSLIGFK